MLFAFLQHAFLASEIRRTSVPNGTIFNIEICIGLVATRFELTAKLFPYRIGLSSETTNALSLKRSAGVLRRQCTHFIKLFDFCLGELDVTKQ